MRQFLEDMIVRVVIALFVCGALWLLWEADAWLDAQYIKRVLDHLH